MSGHYTSPSELSAEVQRVFDATFRFTCACPVRELRLEYGNRLECARCGRPVIHRPAGVRR